MNWARFSLVGGKQVRRPRPSTSSGQAGPCPSGDSGAHFERRWVPAFAGTTVLLWLLALPVHAAEKFPGIGRTATPAEIKAWDIDVRPDFKGLPPGSGSVQKGQQVWESKCESCHGIFAEATDVFSPLVGGTTAADIRSGHVANLRREDYPQRTTLMKLSTLSTMWDYINRAMPWNAPKSLTTEEVYAVTAYILHLGDIVPADFVLSDRNIREVQKRLPNRNGATFFTPMWNVRGKGDTHNTPCMKNCVTEITMASIFPDYARNAHGNLAEQNRVIGPVRGTDTTQALSTAPAGAALAPATAGHAADAAELAKQHNCNICHQWDKKVIGPAFRDVADKYRDRADAESVLLAKVRQGGSGVWGATPMPPNTHVPEGDLLTLVRWVLAGGRS
ncbi:MAG: c-type cytochrome [Betaproteobacteria bacterium]|nr:c-type cytochrome [Betaproteobacteria bacterium]